jgi:ATP-dependent protease ClpP protease subunit
MVARLQLNTSICRLAAAVLFGLATFGTPSSAAEPPVGRLKLSRSQSHPEVLIMKWKGIIRPGMTKAIHKAFEKHKAEFSVIEFEIDSDGGSVREGEHAIAELQEIKKTHKLYTGVIAGRRCGSMCVFIYVQGQKRYAAPASIWLFHEVSRTDKHTKKIYELDREQWERLIDKYWVPAGVSPEWIADMKQHTFQTDYYQTGQDLIAHNSGIVHKALSDERKRKVFPRDNAKPL